MTRRGPLVPVEAELVFRRLPGFLGEDRLVDGARGQIARCIRRTALQCGSADERQRLEGAARTVGQIDVELLDLNERQKSNSTPEAAAEVRASVFGAAAEQPADLAGSIGSQYFSI